MSHHYYEKRLEEDLEQIRSTVQEIAGLVEAGMKNSFHALLALDSELAYRTILADLPINRRTRRLDSQCHYFVARHLPSAGHLRFISSVMRLGIELERIGDYAVTICREAVHLEKPLEHRINQEAENIGRDVLQMFRQSIEAFLTGNADMADATMAYSDQVARACNLVFEELVEDETSQVRSRRDLLATLMIFSRFNRMASQAKNICEETVFAVTGATKQPKTYQVLFLDEGNDVLGPMAAAVARKAFPNSGQYETAGRTPADHLDSRFVDFMDSVGFEVRGEKPEAFRWTPGEVRRFHVIVGLNAAVKDLIGEVPFRTVALEWELDLPPESQASDEDARGRFEEINKSLAVQIRELMETLRGREAN